MKLCMGCMREMEDYLDTCPHCGYNESRVKQESYYLKPGTIIGGKYIVGRVLKYGGYTVKYIGMDAERNMRVTIAEYLPSDFSTRSEGEPGVTIYSGDAMEGFNQGLMTFLNEGNRIQKLGRMPGIAQVYDCLSENDTGYLISEYSEGRTLQDILDMGKTFPAKRAAGLVCSILKGLAQVHAQGIIHCDIAPENIMFTAEHQVKLLDFGASKYVTTANSKSLAIILKQGYAPEEQYRSQGRRGPWTDVYALGAVMYRMITGKIPSESVERALEDDLEEPSKLGIDINPSMENALMNALNIYQKDRTPSAEAFYQELVSPDTQRRKVRQKKRETGKLPVWAKGLVAVVVCALLAGGGVLVHQNIKNQQKKVASSRVEKFSNGVGTTYKEYEKLWKETYDYADKWDEVEKEYCYDSGVGEDTVKEFEDYTDGELKDGAALAEKKNLVPKKTKKNPKKYIAKIVIASKRYVTFQEDWVKNCNQPKEKTTYDEKCYCGKFQEGEDTSRPYGQIKEVVYDSEKYGGDRINNLFDQRLDVSQLSVTIYTGSFYSLPADSNAKEDPDYYKNKNIDNIRFNFGRKENAGTKKALDASFYKEEYISFDSSCGKGAIKDVLSKKIKAGKKYSQREDGGGKLFNVVKELIPIHSQRLTVAEVEKRCKELGWNVSRSKKSFGSNYTVRGTTAGQYKKGETVVISDAVAPPTPTPVPKPVVTQGPAQNSAPKPASPTVTLQPRQDNSHQTTTEPAKKPSKHNKTSGM